MLPQYIFELRRLASFVFRCNQLQELHMQGYSLLSIDASGQTALHYGSRLGHRDIVKYLISYAPNSIVNMVDNARCVFGFSVA